MSGDAREYRERLLDWLRGAVAGGWIAEDDIGALEALESQGADSLFEAGARPLLVGFFGGTGVGKSSLLNRLVGEPLAAVGVERPTSTEVTVYVHERYPVERIEASFPVERVRIATHGRDQYRDVAWIDMPDIDSVEAANRETVFQWLPYLDWLIYVVSPERYRDDAGWRVLRSREHRHHWLFVMNRFDTGNEEQYLDFKKMLAGEGLDEAIVLRTSCAGGADDDFDRMSRAVDDAVAAHGLAALQQVGERARLNDLRRQCERYARMLGDSGQWEEFVRHGASVVSDRLDELNRYLADEAAIEALNVPDRPAHDGRPAAAHASSLPGRVADYVEDLQAGVAVAAKRLPLAPVKARTRAVFESLGARAGAALRAGFLDGMTRPGTALQRRAVALMKRLVYGLPLVVCAGVAYVVVVRYQQGLSGAGPFLGFDFLAHSVMILGLSALAPWLLARLLRPSVRRSIVMRVAGELDRARRRVLEEWRSEMDGLCDQVRELRDSLGAMLDEIERVLQKRPGSD